MRGLNRNGLSYLFTLAAKRLPAVYPEATCFNFITIAIWEYLLLLLPDRRSTMRLYLIKRISVVFLLLITVYGLIGQTTLIGHAHTYRRHHHSKLHKITAIGAPIAIGAAFGPAGSVSYQVVKHRHAIRKHLSHHHHHR
jgi:hypothetical protein